MLYEYPAHNSLLPIFFAWQLAPNASNYNLNFSYSVKDKVEIDLIIESLQQLVQLKAHLRQTFSFDAGRLVACIHDNLPPEINFYSCSTAGFEKLEHFLIKQPHDISNKSSMKLNIIHVNEYNHYVALFNIHHILLDGQSIDQFIQNLNHLLSNEDISEESAEEYLLRIEQESSLQETCSDHIITDYLKKVTDIADKIHYPSASSSTDTLFYTDILSKEIMQKLISLSEEHKISLFNLLLLAWGIFIAKIFDQKSILISYPVNIRENKFIEGCFINNVILPINITSADSYLSIINSWIQETLVFKKITKIKLSDKLGIGSIPGFASSNMARPLELIIKGKRYVAKSYSQIANSNLCIKYQKQKDNYFFSCDVIAELFPNHLSSSILPRFFHFLNKLVSDQTDLLSTIDVLFIQEKQKLLYDFNNNISYYPQNSTIIALFEEQVKKTPNNIALVYEQKKLTYAELNEQANQLAHYLRSVFIIKPDDLIALLIDRDEYMIISILAVLKSGAAYVPLEPNFPQERINYILEDTQAQIILTNAIYREKFNHYIHQPHLDNLCKIKDRHVLEIDSKPFQKKLMIQKISNLPSSSKNSNLAYVIYTSGTTGKPNGVMIEQQSVINTVFSLSKVYVKKNPKIKTPLKITAFTSYVFDVSVAEFFAALLRGHELHILGNSLRQNIILISKYISSNEINYIYLPPVLLASLSKIDYPSLQGIIYAGEPCDKKTACYWSRKYKLYNYYGPTETSIYSTGLQLKTAEVHLIGKPIPNTTAYVLNSAKKLQPIGIIGELYIGGIGLARGYLNQPRLTSERFIDNPFQTAEEKLIGKNERLYKTGDLVRWCADGNLEYIGRNDFQVKIRGYRIELSEIENKLISYPEIKLAIVLVKDPKDSINIHNKYLVAYYLSDQKINESSLLAYLATELPEHMLPNVFVHLTNIPLTINGKLDRKALPDPEFTSIETYAPPSNSHEELVCTTFAQVLDLEKVGVNDDFFKLGGNSIKAITLITKLQVNFNISITDIYNLKTPAQISKNTPFMRNNLKRNLRKFKFDYQKKYIISNEMQHKLDNYLNSIDRHAVEYQKKPITNILLTGATGFLGANLLNQILESTDYNVFLLVRGNSNDEALDRINQKFQFYFEKKLNDEYRHRIFAFAADISKEDLEISKETYQLLIGHVDSIIHSAAFTKHYGEYDQFYSMNVQATMNMLELSKLTHLKDFHYISTVSVLDQGYVPGHDQFYFTEDDIGDNLESRFNPYVSTKYEGERVVLKYRTQGVMGNIYRIGNLAFMASNGRGQENIQDNGFFNRISGLLKLGFTTPAINLEEISPVDLTAQAIIKLFDKKELGNKIFHVFNPNLCDLAMLLNYNVVHKIKPTSIDQFINLIFKRLNNPDDQKLVQRFLLHHGWLNESNNYTTFIQIFQHKTQAILKQLGFEWTSITNKIFHIYFEKEIRNEQIIKHL